MDFVFIMMDDMGYDDMECYGTATLNTPVETRAERCHWGVAALQMVERK